MLFAAFWLGGMVACVLQAWNEFRRGAVEPVVVYSLKVRPVRMGAIVLLALVLWPGYLVFNALRQVDDE